MLDGSDSINPNSLTGYLDGEQFGQGEGSQLWNHSGGIGIGGINRGSKFHDGTKSSRVEGFTGAIDEVKIFNSALDASQVQELSTL